MDRLTALVVIERPAVAFAEAVAAGLDENGVAPTIGCLEGPGRVPLHGVDLVVLGARTGAWSTVDGAVVRRWLRELRPDAPGRLVSAYDVGLGSWQPGDPGTAHHAVRLLTGRGFRPLLPPAGFRALDTTGLTTLDEILRAEAWGAALATAADDVHRETDGLARLALAERSRGPEQVGSFDPGPARHTAAV